MEGHVEHGPWTDGVKIPRQLELRSQPVWGRDGVGISGCTGLPLQRGTLQHGQCKELQSLALQGPCCSVPLHASGSTEAVRWSTVFRAPQRHWRREHCPLGSLDLGLWRRRLCPVWGIELPGLALGGMSPGMARVREMEC